jgi:hypothetical protein
MSTREGHACFTRPIDDKKSWQGDWEMRNTGADACLQPGSLAGFVPVGRAPENHAAFRYDYEGAFIART